jgi:iron(III) transport system ATP-binding protein
MVLRSKWTASGNGVVGRWGRRNVAAVTFASRLTFERVTRRFGKTDAVDDFSLDVAPGEIVCLLGPSGCGKTTALRLAAGVDRPDRGRILLDAMEAAGPSGFVPPEKRGVGLMFQDFALFPHLTVAANVAFGLRDLGRAEARREAMAALDRVGLKHYADLYPHILSGGEQQRVALARAIAPRPNVLLMDEPFSGLDPQLRDAMRDETYAILREMRATCIVVTHSPEEAMRLGDRIAVMRKGRLVQAGSADALYAAPADLDVARSFCAVNEIEARVTGGAARTPIGAFAAPGIEEGARAVVVIRQGGFVFGGGHADAPEAHIHEVRRLGEFAQAMFHVEGVAGPLIARILAHDAPQAGTATPVAVAPGAALAFAATGEDDPDV